MSTSVEAVKVYCDGGSRGNPGPAAGGVVIQAADGAVLGEFSEFYGVQTNNYAEYSAIILALQKLHEMKIGKADFYLDSKLAVEQLNGNYKVKHPNIIPLFRKVKALCEGTEVSFEHVYREHNTAADAMVNQCLDANT